MRKALCLAISVLALSTSAFAQTQQPAPAPAPATQTPAPPPGGGAQGAMAEIQQRLQDLSRQLQPGTTANMEQVRGDADRALNDLQQAMQNMRQEGNQAVSQDQLDSLQDQIDQTRTQLTTDPTQAGQMFQMLADAAQQVGMAQPQPEIPAEADRIIGKQLVTLAGEEAGEVTDVLVTADGQVAAVIVERGGVLGLGGSQISLPWDQIRIQGDQLSVQMSADQLDAMPEYVTE